MSKLLRPRDNEFIERRIRGIEKYLKNVELESITLKNFKSFSDKHNSTLLIKPITLIYGWNNSGKSSLLDFIRLMSKASESSVANSLFSFNANNLINAGSYKNFIHGNDIDNTLSARYEIKNLNLRRTQVSRLLTENKDFLSEVISSNIKIGLDYKKSNNVKEVNLSILNSFNIHIENLLSLKAEKRLSLDDFYNITNLKIDKSLINDFAKKLKIYSGIIISQLKQIEHLIENIDIDYNNKQTIGSDVFKNLQKFTSIVQKNKNLLKKLNKLYDIKKNNRAYFEFRLWLTKQYTTEHEADLDNALSILNRLLYLPSSDRAPGEIIKEIEQAFNLLDWELSKNDDYLNIIKSLNFPINSDKEENKVLKLEFLYRYFSKFNLGPINNFLFDEDDFKELKNHYPILSKPNWIKKNKSKSRQKQKEVFTNLFLEFIKIEKDYISLKERLVDINLKDVKDASQEITNILPGRITEYERLGIQDTSFPVVHIKSSEFNELIKLLENWNGDIKERHFLSIINIIENSFKNTILIKQKRIGFFNDSEIDVTRVITLADIVTKIIDENSSDKLSYLVKNSHIFIAQTISSLRSVLFSRTFNPPSENILRYYEEINIEEFEKQILLDEKYSYEYVFNILKNNEVLCNKVNTSLKKMGFDFELDFESINASFNERLFYILARNIYNKSINTHVADMGLGLKKIIPFITYLFFRKWRGIVCIQEPESNLHPKYQSEIPEVLVDSYIRNKNTHIVETHSEILILRLLKLVKQDKISADNISINFVEKINGESKITNIGLNNDGEFTENWPKGFFKERIDELL